MKDESPVSRQAGEDELNLALESQPADELDALSIRSRRWARLLEYEDEVLDRPAPLAAVIGMGNVTLQKLFEHLGSTLLDEIESRPHSLEDMRQYMPDMRLLTKMRNTIEKDPELLSSDLEPHTAALPHSVKKLNAKVPNGRSTQLPKQWPRNT